MSISSGPKIESKLHVALSDLKIVSGEMQADWINGVELTVGLDYKTRFLCFIIFIG
jgi:hypothetical protein